MQRWIKIASAGDIAPGTGRAVDACGLSLAVFNDNGTYRAIDESCPHQGASLADGVMHDGRVVCPLHAWVFDLETGRCPRDTHDPVAVYPVREIAGSIEVAVPADASAPESR